QIPVTPFFAISSVLHCVWAGWGMLLLGRTLGRSRVAAGCGALLFAGGGFFSARLFAGQYPHICSAAWLPWFFWMLLRARRSPRRFGRLGWGGVAGVMLALQVYAGFPQFVLITLTGAVLLWLVDGRTLVLTGAVAAILAVPVLLPVVRFMAESQRTAGMSPAEALRDSLGWHSVLTPVMPLGVIDPFSHAGLARVTEFWETCGFVGWSPLVLLLAAAGGLWRRRVLRRWLLLGGVSLLLATGPHWLQAVPVLSLLRSPGRWLLLTVTAAAVLTAYAVDHLRRRRAWRPLLAWLPVLLTAELAWLAWTLLLPPCPYAVGVPYWSQDTATVRFLQAQPPPFRIAALADYPLLNEAIYHRLESINGYQGLVPRRFYEVLRLHDPQIATATPLYLHRPDNPAFRLLNVGFVVTRRALESTDTRWQAPVFTDGAVRVYRLPWPAPRVWLPRAYRACRTEADVLEELARPDFDPQALAAGIGGTSRVYDNDTATVLSAAYGDPRRGECVLMVTVMEPRMLVVSEHYLPGSRVLIDGQPARSMPVDHALLGVVVPAGSHRVTISHE
ncbi:MAG TPA: hypothetical protein PKM88_10565, partial [bacterium]|nr:hypothetical protein [bacterium]